MLRTLFVVAAAVLAVVSASSPDDKSIVDPVLKHDAKQCGQYLCPGFPNAAEVRTTPWFCSPHAVDAACLSRSLTHITTRTKFHV